MHGQILLIITRKLDAMPPKDDRKHRSYMLSLSSSESIGFHPKSVTFVKSMYTRPTNGSGQGSRESNIKGLRFSLPVAVGVGVPAPRPYAQTRHETSQGRAKTLPLFSGHSFFEGRSQILKHLWRRVLDVAYHARQAPSARSPPMHSSADEPHADCSCSHEVRVERTDLSLGRNDCRRVV